MVPRTQHTRSINTLTVYRVGTRSTIVVRDARGLVLTADVAHGPVTAADLTELYGCPFSAGDVARGVNAVGQPWTATHYAVGVPARGGDR